MFWLIVGKVLLGLVVAFGICSLGFVVGCTIQAFRGKLGTDVPENLKDLF
jgi:hypothetical protein